MNHKSVVPGVEWWLGVFLAWTVSSTVLAQTGSVVTVNADMALVINGRKVFPIGFSPGPPNNTLAPNGRDGLQELRDAGALVTKIAQSSNWDSTLIAYQQATLDWAGQHGMYCWVNLRELSQFPSTDTNTPASLRSLVDTFRNHPALGVWKNYDEAWWGKISETNLQNGYEVIRQEDINHPVEQTHAPRGTVTDFQPYDAAADIIAVDIYPVTVPQVSNPPLTNTNISQVGDWTLVMAQVAGGQKQFWTIEQIASSGTTPPAHVLIFPTFAQSRYMAYQALIDGARGLMFFGANVTATLTPQDTLLGWNWTFWNGVLKPVVQQLGDHSPLAPALVAPNSTLPITISGTSAPDLEYCVREVPPYLFILASKREGATVNVTFSGLPSWTSTGEVLFESPRVVTAQSGQFTDSFAPFDVHVYRFCQTNQHVTILYPPQSQTNYAGTTADLSVMADGTGPLTYQWRKNGINLSNGGNVSGATSSTLALASASASDVASYTVVVTGFGGVSVTSAPPATLSLSNQPPVIATQPQSQSGSAGTAAAFNVLAVGSPPLAYQWRKNGANLADGGIVSGASSSALTLSSVSQTDAASYDVVVTGFGSVTSAPPATLTVTSPLGPQLILYEPFDYPNVGGPVTSNTPANWTYGGSGANDLNVVSGSLTYPGLAASVGNSVTNGGAGFGVRRLFGTNFSSGILYFSAIFRINDAGFGVWNGGSTIVGALTPTDNTTFRHQVMIKSNSPSGYLVGVQKGGTGATSTYDPTEHHAGETFFLVGKYDFTTSPNSALLWINPSSATFGLASEPATGFIAATTGADGYTIDRFNMRQNTATSVPAAMQWDELRIGTSWAAVTPLPPPVPTTLTSLRRLGNGAFQFAYTNPAAQTGSVYASTNLLTWLPVGVATQISSGLYQFTDGTATNYPERFYKLRPQ